MQFPKLGGIGWCLSVFFLLFPNSHYQFRNLPTFTAQLGRVVKGGILII